MRILEIKNQVKT